MEAKTTGATPEGLTTVELRAILQRIARGIWTTDRLVYLCDQYAGGVSTGQIGERMGCGKNAVIGKVHRLIALNILKPRGQAGGGWSAGRTAKNPQDAAEGLRKARAASRRETGATTGRMEGAAQLAHALKVTVPPETAPAARVASSPRLTPQALNRPLAARPPVVPEPIARIPVAPPVPSTQAIPFPDTPMSEPERLRRQMAATLRAKASRAPSLPTMGSEGVAPVRYGRVTECCWPIGTPATPTFRFCDGPSLPGGSYCEGHASKAYLKVRGHAAPMAGTGALLGAP